MYFRERMECWYFRRIERLYKPFLSHVINMFAPMHLADYLVDFFLRIFYYRCFKGFVVIPVVELHLDFSYFFIAIHDDCV